MIIILQEHYKFELKRVLNLQNSLPVYFGALILIDFLIGRGGSNPPSPTHFLNQIMR